MGNVVLVDGKNMAWRAHFKHMHLSSKGRPTSVIFGFLSMLITLKKKFNCPIVIIWDGKGKTWRHKIRKEYKNNRSHLNEAREIVNKQIPTLKNFLVNCLGYLNVEISNLEADDMIGVMAKFLVDELNFDKVIIHSGDRDFYQLLSDKIVIYSAQGKRKGFILTKEKMEKINGLTSDQYLKMRSLCGDKSDNIKNIKRVGGKTAIKLVKAGLDPSFKKFGSHPSKIRKEFKVKFKPYWETVHENYQLSKIITVPHDPRVPFEVKVNICNLLKDIRETGKLHSIENFNYRKVLDFLVNYELDEIFNRRKDLIR